MVEKGHKVILVRVRQETIRVKGRNCQVDGSDRIVRSSIDQGDCPLEESTIVVQDESTQHRTGSDREVGQRNDTIVCL